MFQIASIDHIVLRTSQLSTMLHFYTQVLGCHVERETPTETGLTQLRAGNALIDLVAVDSELGRLGGGTPTASANNLDHFCLQLSPISEQEIRQHLSNFGINNIEFDQRYGAQGMGQSVYISDPDGNTIELRSQQPTNDSLVD